VSQQQSGILGSALDLLVPIHRDGHKFIAIAAAIALLLFFIWPSLAWLAVLTALWIAYFFRDPDRVTPVRPGLVLAPADGKVIDVQEVSPPRELGLGEPPRTRVAIHLSLFDVHINRSPIAGRVARSVYVPGAFNSLTMDKAGEDNERRALMIADDSGREIAVVQIAGVISRRIVTFAGEGDALVAGQRFGLIRFGSRVDLYLPEGTAALVAAGQRMIAGETVIADLASREPAREVRRG
jgi:phosphatidylserine decarboxylase